MISMNLTTGRSGVLTTIIINTLYKKKKPENNTASRDRQRCT